METTKIMRRIVILSVAKKPLHFNENMTRWSALLFLNPGYSNQFLNVVYPFFFHVLPQAFQDIQRSARFAKEAEPTSTATAPP